MNAGEASNRARAVFDHIAAAMSDEHGGVAPGRMMSRPAIQHRGKVFAFYRVDRMVFRLGRAFDPEAAGLTGVTLLSPFRHKPPMKDWFCVPFAHADRWRGLAEDALALMAVKEKNAGTR